jgi:hypothetical protein
MGILWAGKKPRRRKIPLLFKPILIHPGFKASID